MSSASNKLTFNETVKSFVLCKQIRDLLETCLAIIEDLPEKEQKDLPNKRMINMILSTLDGAYPKLTTDEGKMNRESIKDFCKDEDNLFISKEIYTHAQNLDTAIVDKISDRDENFFIDNVDKLLASFPAIGEDQLNKFKKFTRSNSLSDEDKQDIWDFVDYIISINKLDDVGTLFKR